MCASLAKEGNTMISGRGTTAIRELPVDAEVFTSDGDRIGKIREVGSGSFKVDAAMRPDYWLPTDTVASTTGNRVTLSFHKDRLGEYKSDKPAYA